MRLLYFDCYSGVSGDMALGALLDIYGDTDAFLTELDKIGLRDAWDFKAEKTVKHGISGTDAEVILRHNGHRHRGFSDIRNIIENSQLDKEVKTTAVAIFANLAQAEARVHGISADKVYFHEVGAIDAIIDIVGVSILIDFLKPDACLCSPVLTGCGTVQCAHGELPVPAPATAELLKGFPVYSGGREGERVTPTGAAIIKTLCRPVPGLPLMTAANIGYGFGKKDFGGTNALRVFLGDSQESSQDVCLLEANIDDMTGETLGAAMQALIDAGALDAWCTPIFMKKQRPAYCLSALCPVEDRERFEKLILAHTSTLGVRHLTYGRAVLERSEKTCDTSFGPVRLKYAKGYGVEKCKIEYEDILRVAGERGIPFEEARLLIMREMNKRL